MVVWVLFKAGDQVPVIPLLEVVGKAESVAPEQIGATCVKVGVDRLLTTTVVWAVAGGEQEILSIKGLSPLSKPVVQIPNTELVL